MKFNNHPAPPKVGVTAAESGTYTDFANINIGGVRTRRFRCGERGLLPAARGHRRDAPPAAVEQHPAVEEKPRPFPSRPPSEVIRKGYGFPSIFNSDAVVEELVRQGKTVEDAREGGTSGCVEAGAFGKEAYILTGYFNLPKMLELALHDGVDPRTGEQLGPQTGDPSEFSSFDELFEAWRTQVRHFVDIKYRGNLDLRADVCRLGAGALSDRSSSTTASRMAATTTPAALATTPAISRGSGSAASPTASRPSNTTSLTMGPSPCRTLIEAIDSDFEGREALRQRLLNKTPRYGNDDDRADDIMVRCFEAFFETVDGRPNLRGGEYHIDMLPTTCHVYFGSVIGAMPDGRCAGVPLSEGISPGAGRGPPGADRGLQIGGQDGPPQDRRHPPQYEVHATSPRGYDRHRHDDLAGARLLRHGQPPRAVQRRHCRDPARGAGRSQPITAI